LGAKGADEIVRHWIPASDAERHVQDDRKDDKKAMKDQPTKEFHKP
jgi:hypothetical protein